MRQFIKGSRADFLALENQAQGKCIRFKNEEMPPGSEPSKAHVGFEVESGSGKTILWVSRGVEYRGLDAEIGAWFSNGKKEFTTFDEMVRWIKERLSAAYGIDAEVADGLARNEGTADRNTARSERDGENRGQNEEPAVAQRRRSSVLTDYTAVREGLSEPRTAGYIDADSLFSTLKEKVKGQDYALRTLAGVVTRHYARVNPSRPAVLFAIGPTGVGKTKSAEALPEAIRRADEEGNAEEYNYLRLDMSEYQEAHRVSQLIGAPQGYVGHGQGSQLTDTLKKKPRTIVLFDEIEKAHPSILKLLMNAMDAGRLSTAESSDGSHEVECKHAIFIFTSNLHAKAILNEFNRPLEELSSAEVDEISRKHVASSGIPAEIVGRINRFLIYTPLGREERAEILALSIAELAEEYGVEVVFIAPELIIHIFGMIGEDSFGVRPAWHLLDEELGDVFARASRQQYDRIRLFGPPYYFEAA